jgi:hypothetical protein
MHYIRRYRHDDTNKTAVGSGIHKHQRKYHHMYRPGHPLASRNGKVYEHRLVLYDKVGPSPQSCHWCGKRIVWLVADPIWPNDPRLIFADHLDRDTANNDPDNLVPVCFNCNIARGKAARHEALKAQGWWSGNDTVHNRRSWPPTG